MICFDLDSSKFEALIDKKVIKNLGSDRTAVDYELKHHSFNMEALDKSFAILIFVCILDQDTLSALLQPSQLNNEYQVGAA